MAIQLAGDPIIKINGEELEGYYFIRFKMTKRLLEPNRLVFVFSKEDLGITQEDIQFELREKLLGALVEVSVTSNFYHVDDDDETVEVPNFFRGYIQNIQVTWNVKTLQPEIQCTAYSPDARLKTYPACSSRVDDTLSNYVSYILRGPTDHPRKFNADSGKYEDWTPMDMEINPTYQGTMPYTVQYHESDYDFLKRLAKRYGEYFYYEDGKIVFGKMKEYDPVTLRAGVGIENFTFDLNMNQHTGIVLYGFDYLSSNRSGHGVQKGDYERQSGSSISGPEMSMSVYKHATEFYNADRNNVSYLESHRILNEAESIAFKEDIAANGGNPKGSLPKTMQREQRIILEKYIMSDTLRCKGSLNRPDMKLGSVIVIEEETRVREGNTDYVKHDPMKIIDLTYTWKGEKSLTLENEFTAIPQTAVVPPYLERDENGFLTYGDFDVFPHCGPMSGRVINNRDPYGLGRVQVALFWQVGVEVYERGIKDPGDVMDNYTPWIRVAQPYGGYRQGAYLVPEINDEVLVGFECNNAERPYVICSLHNTRVDEVEPKWVEKGAVEANEVKAFRTRNGHTVEVHDKESHGYIKIYDEKTHNYVVTYDTDNKKIRLESKGNIELSADRNIVLHAGNNIVMEAKNNIESHAENDIKRTADHDTWDVEGNDYINKIGNDFNSFIADTQAHIHMIKDRIQLELDGSEQIIRMDKSEGISLDDTGPGTQIKLLDKNSVVINAKSTIDMKSDLEMAVKAKLIGVEAEMEYKLTSKFVTLEADGPNTIKGSPVKVN